MSVGQWGQINKLTLILHPTYFSPIAHYIALANNTNLIFEVQDNYQKQTYRTRCSIYGANGKQMLTVPIQHPVQRKLTKDIQIDDSFAWQKQHIKSLQSAYRSSPFFEYYEDDILTLFDKKEKFLLDFNFQAQETIAELLPLEFSFSKTEAYNKVYNELEDLRFLADAKSQRHYGLAEYIQVFSDKHGFIENLSILDLLFMEGPNALNYLEHQQFKFV